MPVVVAGVDNSPTASLVVSRAIEEAGWRGLALHLVHVTYALSSYGDIPVDWSAIHDAERRAVWDLVTEASSGSDVMIETVDLEGYPPDTLVSYSNTQQAELLVVGTRGRGDLASLILGSTSHRALHLSECDVLVVKPEQAG